MVEDQVRASRTTLLTPDSPDFDFGKKTGLLHPMHRILQCAVMVLDEHNIVWYIEIVSMSQLPNFAAALTVKTTIRKHVNVLQQRHAGRPLR
ncbi:MAG: hypothetical protein OXF47_11150 [Nitrospira sp.]|nr:hypothetical protein [Nitrospira sp.]